jgi:hypothetical protein
VDDIKATIVIRVGGKTIELTPAEAQELRSVLDELPAPALRPYSPVLPVTEQWLWWLYPASKPQPCYYTYDYNTSSGDTTGKDPKGL